MDWGRRGGRVARGRRGRDTRRWTRGVLRRPQAGAEGEHRERRRPRPPLGIASKGRAVPGAARPGGRAQGAEGEVTVALDQRVSDRGPRGQGLARTVYGPARPRSIQGRSIQGASCEVPTASLGGQRNRVRLSSSPAQLCRAACLTFVFLAAPGFDIRGTVLGSEPDAPSHAQHDDAGHELAMVAQGPRVSPGARAHLLSAGPSSPPRSRRFRGHPRARDLSRGPVLVGRCKFRPQPVCPLSL